MCKIFRIHYGCGHGKVELNPCSRYELNNMMSCRNSPIQELDTVLLCSHCRQHDAEAQSRSSGSTPRQRQRQRGGYEYQDEETYSGNRRHNRYGDEELNLRLEECSITPRDSISNYTSNSRGSVSERSSGRSHGRSNVSGSSRSTMRIDSGRSGMRSDSGRGSMRIDSGSGSSRNSAAASARTSEYTNASRPRPRDSQRGESPPPPYSTFGSSRSGYSYGTSWDNVD